MLKKIIESKLLKDVSAVKFYLMTGRGLGET